MAKKLHRSRPKSQRAATDRKLRQDEMYDRYTLNYVLGWSCTDYESAKTDGLTAYTVPYSGYEMVLGRDAINFVVEFGGPISGPSVS